MHERVLGDEHLNANLRSGRVYGSVRGGVWRLQQQQAHGRLRDGDQQRCSLWELRNDVQRHERDGELRGKRLRNQLQRGLCGLRQQPGKRL